MLHQGKGNVHKLITWHGSVYGREVYHTDCGLLLHSRLFTMYLANSKLVGYLDTPCHQLETTSEV